MDINYDSFIKREVLNEDDPITTLFNSQINIPVKNEPILDEPCPFLTIKKEQLTETVLIDECVTIKTENQLTEPADSFLIYELEAPPLIQSLSKQNLQNVEPTPQFIPQIRPLNVEQLNQLVVNKNSVAETNLNNIPVTNTTPVQDTIIPILPSSAAPPPILLNSQLRKRHKVVLPLNPADKRTCYNIEGKATTKVLTKPPTRAYPKSKTKILNKCRSLNAGSKKIINLLIRNKRNQSKYKEIPMTSDNCAQELTIENTVDIASMEDTLVSLTPTDKTITSSNKTELSVIVSSSPSSVEPSKPEICLPTTDSSCYTSDLRVKCLYSLTDDKKDALTNNSELRAFFLEMFEETRRLNKKQQRKVKMTLLQAISEAEDLVEHGKCYGF